MLDEMAKAASPAYDAELEICGETQMIKRSLGLMKRLEQRLGALTVFAARVERFAVAQAELAVVYQELLRGGPPGQMPERHAIEAWIYARGTHACCRDLVRLLYELTVGSDRLREHEEQRRIDAEEAAERAGTPFPAASPATASSTGPA